MKKIGDYTTRGSIRTDNAINRIILDDGSFETGYRVVEFKIGPHDMDQQSTLTYTAKLMTDDDSSIGINWNWDNNEEIGWSIFGWDSNGPQFNQEFALIDPDNLVIQDLYIIADEPGTGSDVKINYYIRLEKYDISDSQAALAMVRNRSQA
jgi:hypothetical protein